MSMHTLVVGFALLVGMPLVPAQTPPQTIYEPGNGVVSPVLTYKIDPRYTQEAMRAKITGEVWLDVVVNSDGTVQVLGVKKSLDRLFGLDNAAVEAAKQWHFTPGTYNGQVVPVRVVLIMEYRLHDGPNPNPPNDDFAKGTFKPTDEGVVAPVLLTGADPKYTSDALVHRITGVVQVEAVVLEDGTVGKARIAKSLDPLYGLDGSALDTAKGYVFKPGTRNGQPASFDLIITLEFRIH